MLAAAVDSGSAGRAIDARALSKLRWRCRRGLLENDFSSSVSSLAATPSARPTPMA